MSASNQTPAPSSSTTWKFRLLASGVCLLTVIVLYFGESLWEKWQRDSVKKEAGRKANELATSEGNLKNALGSDQLKEQMRKIIEEKADELKPDASQGSGSETRVKLEEKILGSWIEEDQGITNRYLKDGLLITTLHMRDQTELEESGFKIKIEYAIDIDLSGSWSINGTTLKRVLLKLDDVRHAEPPKVTAPEFAKVAGTESLNEFRELMELQIIANFKENSDAFPGLNLPMEDTIFRLSDSELQLRDGDSMKKYSRVESTEPSSHASVEDESGIANPDGGGSLPTTTLSDAARSAAELMNNPDPETRELMEKIKKLKDLSDFSTGSEK